MDNQQFLSFLFLLLPTRLLSGFPRQSIQALKCCQWCLLLNMFQTGTKRRVCASVCIRQQIVWIWPTYQLRALCQATPTPSQWSPTLQTHVFESNRFLFRISFFFILSLSEGCLFLRLNFFCPPPTCKKWLVVFFFISDGIFNCLGALWTIFARRKLCKNIS